MNIKDAEIMFHDAAIALSKEKLHFHSIQFVVKDEKYKYIYKPYGSGVLIQMEEQYFIFTASHVTNGSTERPLYVNTRVGYQQVIGSCNETDLEVDKQFDLAYIILDQMLGKLLTETYQFLPITKISHSRIPRATANYMVCGYPTNNIWSKDGDIYTGSSHFLLSMANEKIYKYYGFDSNVNYVLDFAGKGIDIRTNEKSEKIGELYGLSGSGLWFLQVRPESGKMVLDYFLIGIMTEFRKTKYYVLVANKIESVMRDLEEKGPYIFDWAKVSE